MKIMRILFCLLFVSTISLTCLPVRADEPVWTLTTGVFNEYLAKPGIVLYDRPECMNSLSVNIHDYYAGIWSSTPIGEPYNINLGSEIDLYAGWHKKFSMMSVDIRGTYLALYDLGKMDNDLWAFDAEVDFDKVPIIQPYLATRHYGQIGSKSPGPGTFGWVGIKRNQPLGLTIGKDKLRVCLDSALASSDGALGREGGLAYWRTGLTLPIGIFRNLTFAPSLTYQYSLDQGNKSYTKGKDDLVYGFNLIYKF